jgi:hypothetical protein
LFPIIILPWVFVYAIYLTRLLDHFFSEMDTNSTGYVANDFTHL